MLQDKNLGVAEAISELKITRFGARIFECWILLETKFESFQGIDLGFRW